MWNYAFFVFWYNMYTSAVWSQHHNIQTPWAATDEQYANQFWRH